MRAATAPFIQYLATHNEFAIADLYTFTLRNGVVLRLTSWDVDITTGGNTFSSAGPYVSRSRVKQSVGLDVDELSIVVLADIAHAVMEIPFLQAVAKGFFRGANVRVDRLFIADPYPEFALEFDPIIWFIGDVGNVEIDPLSATLSVKSALYILDAKLPRNVMQASCRHVLFDAGCKLVKSTFAVANSISAGTSSLVINPTSAIVQADEYFSQGTLEFTSGANVGIARTIKQQVGGKVYLHLAFPFTVNVGDAFNLFPGCDKLQATCTTKFSNLANYGGEPYVPVPETTL